MNRPWSISDSLHYWVCPNLDVLYWTLVHLRFSSLLSAPELGRLVLSINYYGSSLHSYEGPNREAQRHIQRSFTTYGLSANSAIGKSSFLFRSGFSLDSSLADALWLLFILSACMAYGNSIPRSSLVYFSPELKRPLEWLQHSRTQVLTSYWRSPHALALVIAKTFNTAQG